MQTNSIAESKNSLFAENQNADRFQQTPHPRRDHYVCDLDAPPAQEFSAIAQCLAGDEDLFRFGNYEFGLQLVRENGHCVAIRSAPDLSAVITDRMDLQLVRDGKLKGGLLPSAFLTAMLRSERFLSAFPVVDCITRVPRYLPGFQLCRPGFNDGGEHHRVLYRGENPMIVRTLDRTKRFLDVMHFESNADRTNAVAAALTVDLYSLFPGAKPIIVVTANKSHSGKDTVILSASGVHRQCPVSYHSTNWAMERHIVDALIDDPETRVIVLENARLERGNTQIASAFVERLATDPEPLLSHPGMKAGIRRRNEFVLAISTNFGTVSEDIMNRSLPINLHACGNVADRESPIGNPKLEYLPREAEGLAAERRGMIERWREAGQPLAEVNHSFSEWAAVVGGILQVNGFKDFLQNLAKRRVANDALREGVGLLGASICSEEWHQPETWARQVADQGLTKQLLPTGDRDGLEAQKRGIGRVLSAHQDETFLVETEDQALTLKLEKRRARFRGSQPHVRYRFLTLNAEPLPVDEE